ncbi:MAG: acyl-CoA thioesterase [Proteobacteria bacterium]|nr:acyl-CoA thioesterase [Pseudomonadota bacterium]
MASEYPEREDPGFYQHWIDENVRFHDIDAYNHVNNNVIGIYFETARMAWLEQFQPKGWLTAAHFVLAKVTLEFLRELNYPNKIRVGSRVLRIGNSSMLLAGGVFCKGQCMALTESVSVWIGNKTRKPERIPDAIRKAYEGH